jgi:hypothetical protein
MAQPCIDCTNPEEIQVSDAGSRKSTVSAIKQSITILIKPTAKTYIHKTNKQPIELFFLLTCFNTFKNSHEPRQDMHIKVRAWKNTFCKLIRRFIVKKELPPQDRLSK